jgi:RNA polymerase sigma-70 factor (ECF subfamily)
MNSTQMHDSALVSNYVNGNESCLDILLNRHQPRVFNFIYSKVLDKETAEDIFQNTFIKVIRILKKGGYKEEGKFLPWVMRIAHNMVIDHFRSKKRTSSLFFRNTDDFDIFSTISDDVMNVESEIIQTQVYEEVRTLLTHLPKSQEDVLRMRIFKDMSFQEIAENTNVSINTALGRMRYALINLRKLAQKKGVLSYPLA